MHHTSSLGGGRPTSLGMTPQSFAHLPLGAGTSVYHAGGNHLQNSAQPPPRRRGTSMWHATSSIHHGAAEDPMGSLLAKIPYKSGMPSVEAVLRMLEEFVNSEPCVQLREMVQASAASVDPPAGDGEGAGGRGGRGALEDAARGGGVSGLLPRGSSVLPSRGLSLSASGGLGPTTSSDRMGKSSSSKELYCCTCAAECYSWCIHRRVCIVLDLLCPPAANTAGSRDNLPAHGSQQPPHHHGSFSNSSFVGGSGSTTSSISHAYVETVTLLARFAKNYAVALEEGAILYDPEFHTSFLPRLTQTATDAVFATVRPQLRQIVDHMKLIRGQGGEDELSYSDGEDGGIFLIK